MRKNKTISRFLPTTKKGLQIGNGAALFVILLLVGGTLFFTGAFTVPDGGGPVPPGDGDDNGQSAFCIQNPGVDWQFIIRDDLVTDTTYLHINTVLIDNTRDEIVTSLTDIGATLATGTTSTNAISCGAPTKIYIQSNATTVGKLVADLSTTDTKRDPVITSARTAVAGNLSVRFFDNDENAFVWCSFGCISSGSQDQNAYKVLNTTGQVWMSTADNVTGTTINADESIDFNFQVRTTLADRQGGIVTYVCVDNSDDTNSNDWEEPIISWRGQVLTDVRNELTANDQLALTAYEYCYNLGEPVPEISTTGNIKMLSGSGVNPDYDFRLRFLYAGIFLDDDDPNNIIGLDQNVFFRTDTGRTEFASEEAAVAKFDIV